MNLGVIKIQIADLRKEPQELIPKDFSHHPLRESQLLYGETVNILEKWNQWLRVEALEQKKYSSERGWHSYPGWIYASEVDYIEKPLVFNAAVKLSSLIVPELPFPLSYGTLLSFREDGKLQLPTGGVGSCDPHGLRLLPCTFSKEAFLSDAKLFLNSPYLWGGRSSFNKNPIGSVDCSGYINLLFRSQGIEIPRDAHDQYLKAHPITAQELQLGDLVFLSREGKPERITHVVIYTGSMTYLEAPETGKKIRSLSFLSPLTEKVQLEDRAYFHTAHYGRFNRLCIDCPSLNG